MDSGAFSLFIKLIRDDYKLNDDEITRLSHRMLADEKEFERVWEAYKTKARKTRKGVDAFQAMLQDLLGN